MPDGGLGEKSMSEPRIADILTELDERGDKATVLKALQIVEPKATDIVVGSIQNKPLVFVQMDELKRKMPVALLGAGVRKLLSLAIALAAESNATCLLDEVTVGWHYSRLEDLWRVIFRVCKERGHQVIATTHSHEGIAAFAQAAKDEGTQDDACYIRLDRRDEESDPKRKVTYAIYGGELLWFATHEMEEEVR